MFGSLATFKEGIINKDVGTWPQGRLWIIKISKIAYKKVYLCKILKIQEKTLFYQRTIFLLFYNVQREDVHR